MVKFAACCLNSVTVNSIIALYFCTEFCENKKNKVYYGKEKRERSQQRRGNHG